jgi:hypothetical protein
VEATVKKRGCARQEAAFNPRQAASNGTNPARRKDEGDMENISIECS